MNHVWSCGRSSMWNVLERCASLQWRLWKLVFRRCLRVVVLREECLGIRGMGEIQMGHSLCSIWSFYNENIFKYYLWSTKISIKIKKGKNEDGLSDSLANTRCTWAGDGNLIIRHNKRNREALSNRKKQTQVFSISFHFFLGLEGQQGGGPGHSLVLPFSPDLWACHSLSKYFNPLPHSLCFRRIQHPHLTPEIRCNCKDKT